MPATMPVLFVGHGSPMNAIEHNEFSTSWQAMALDIPKPKLVLCVSAHWLQEGTGVTSMQKPKTIHDFYGFPHELNRVQYPAKGSPAHAKLVQKLVKTTHVQLDTEWGLDHGTWSVLKNMYPKANIPVLQVSLDYKLPLDRAVQVGKELAALRNKGVLIMGSGNLVHNLMAMNPASKPFDWAVDFDKRVASDILKGNTDKLIHYDEYHSAMQAHPSNDHYLPLLYAIGAAQGDTPTFYNDKIVYGSISMRCVKFGGTQ